jgi:glycosyltransferase involved in cell wall biosynthesis
MSAESPSISILLSTHFGADFVCDCIESILTQSFSDFELLILDDASGDNTWDLIKKFHDARIITARNMQRHGLFPNLNQLLMSARGSLIKLVGQDDILRTDCLASGWRFYCQNPGVGYFYSNNSTINAAGTVVRPPEPDEGTPTILSQQTADTYSFLYGCLSANISNLFLPKDVVDGVGGFDETTISADFDLLVRIQEQYPAGHIHDPLVYIRDHPKQWSRSLDGVADYICKGIDLHLKLMDRVVNRHHAMTEKEARDILVRKSADNYFDNMILLLAHGRFSDAQTAYQALRAVAPVSRLARLWLKTLAARMRRKIGI